MLLVKKEGKKSERVTAVIIGGGGSAKATRPTGEVALRAREPASDSFQTFLPPLAGECFAQRGEPAAQPLGVGHASPPASGYPVLPALAHSRPQLSQIATAQ